MSVEKSKVMILFIAALLLLVSFFFLEDFDNLTGNTVSYDSQAGNVTEVNINSSTSSWHGFFGEITVNISASTASAIVKGGEMAEFDLELPCSGGELYLSTLNNLDFTKITKGTAEAVDNYLSFDSSNQQSGTQVFNNLSSFIVNETFITDAPTTYTTVKNSPGDTTFNLGVLNHSDHLVFVSSIRSDTIGFDGDTHDYQMMVPINESGVIYYFFSDCAVTALPEEPEAVLVPPGGNPSQPSLKPPEIVPPVEKIPLPIIEIIEKEGKLLATSYTIAIVVAKGEKTVQKIQIRNIGEGALTNIFIVVSGLPLEIFSVTPEKYDQLSPLEVKDFTLELSEDLDAGTHDIEILVHSDQGYTRIEGILIVKGLPTEEPEKLPLVGAAAGFAGKYGKILVYAVIILVLLALLYIYFKKIQRIKIGNRRTKKIKRRTK